MLTTSEKVQVLKNASVFADTPDDALAEVAAIMDEVRAMPGQRIIEKGDAGDSMYVITAGRVRIHDGAHTIDHAETGGVFGEMALVDPQPRMASVTAVEDTRLLRLDQASFSRLMDAHPQVTRGIVQMLARRLRDRVHDLTGLEERADMRARREDEFTFPP
jgi:CRP-like cAMP-binding protein